MAGALVVALVLSAPFLFVVARKPVLRRLALRNAARRPKEALLVVLGSLLGAAIITGSFIVGDTVDAAIRQIAASHLGPVDELVLARDQTDFAQLRASLRGFGGPDVDGVLPIVSLDAAAVSTASGELLTSPHSQVVAVDFGKARRFGGDEHATGMSGPTPRPDHAAVTTDLARVLELKVGDVIDVYAYGRATHLFVDRVLPRRGLAGFSTTGEQEARNVLVSPATFRTIAAPANWPSRIAYAPPRYAVAISNTGGVESGAERTAAVDERLVDTLFGGAGAQIVDVKKATLDAAESQGKAFRDLFTSMGTFGVLAGLLLLVNLFVMLAAERKGELGMIRAVGLRRSALVGAFATEGWLYALTASLLGAILGIGLGRLIVAASQRAFTSEHAPFELPFTVRPDSIAQGFMIGFVVALVTVVATSVRVSRLNIIRAIRDLPEPRTGRLRRAWVVAGALAAALGAVWTVSAVSSEAPMGLLLAPVLLLAGLAPVLARFVDGRRPVIVVAALAMVWAACVFAVFSDAFDGAGISVFIVQGIVLVGAGVLLAALLQEHVAGAVRRLPGGRRLSARLGFAYPLARRSRTGLTVAMFALVIFILTFITTMSHMIGQQVDTTTARISGGYSVIVDSNASSPVSPATIRKRDGVWAVAALYPTSAEFTASGFPENTSWPLTAFDNSLLDAAPPHLEDRGIYTTDREAWLAVLHDPNLIVVDAFFLQSGAGPSGQREPVGVGDTVTLTDPFSGRSRAVTVAAVATTDALVQNGAAYGMQGARQVFGDRLVPSRSYVALRSGVDPEDFAARLQGDFAERGAEANSIRSLMDESFAMTNRIFLLFEGYLAMGLIVGIAGLAVVMVRAVRERRREIGTLRALGFQPRAVGAAFAVESGFIALEGTVLGVALALVTLYNIVARSDAMGDFGGFSVPYGTLAVLLFGTVLAALLATVGPAASASRIRPAVALRTSD